MTPSHAELLERAYYLRELYDDMGDAEGHSNFDMHVMQFVEDVIEELESA
jgi:hypothetical protein